MKLTITIDIWETPASMSEDEGRDLMDEELRRIARLIADDGYQAGEITGDGIRGWWDSIRAS